MLLDSGWGVLGLLPEGCWSSWVIRCSAGAVQLGQLGVWVTQLPICCFRSSLTASMGSVRPRSLSGLLQLCVVLIFPTQLITNLLRGAARGVTCRSAPFSQLLLSKPHVGLLSSFLLAVRLSRCVQNGFKNASFLFSVTGGALLCPRICLCSSVPVLLSGFACSCALWTSQMLQVTSLKYLALPAEIPGQALTRCCSIVSSILGQLRVPPRCLQSCSHGSSHVAVPCLDLPSSPSLSHSTPLVCTPHPALTPLLYVPDITFSP